MIPLGLVLMLLGLLLAIPVLWSLGVVVLLIGLILAVAGYSGHGWGGRRHYW
jgi:hypothetical protein